MYRSQWVDLTELQIFIQGVELKILNKNYETMKKNIEYNFGTDRNAVFTLEAKGLFLSRAVMSCIAYFLT